MSDYAEKVMSLMEELEGLQEKYGLSDEDVDAKYFHKPEYQMLAMMCDLGLPSEDDILTKLCAEITAEYGGGE